MAVQILAGRENFGGRSLKMPSPNRVRQKGLYRLMKHVIRGMVPGYRSMSVEQIGDAILGQVQELRSSVTYLSQELDLAHKHMASSQSTPPTPVGTWVPPQSNLQQTLDLAQADLQQAAAEGDIQGVKMAVERINEAASAMAIETPLTPSPVVNFDDAIAKAEMVVQAREKENANGDAIVITPKEEAEADSRKQDAIKDDVKPEVAASPKVSILDAIRGGVKLKKAEVVAAPKQVSILDAIKGGVKLKKAPPVQEQDEPPRPPSKKPMGDTFTRKMLARRSQISGNDEPTASTQEWADGAYLRWR